MPSLVFETFEVELQNILYNLYDPIYTPELHIYPVFLLTPTQDALSGLREKIIAEIDGLKSRTGYPQPTKSDILYEVLATRFIQGLSQEKAAEQLGMSTRHLRRKQNEAIHALATRIWHAYQAADEPFQPAQGSTAVPTYDGEGASWAESMIHELEVLQSNTPKTMAGSEETLRRVVKLAAYLPGSDQIELVVAPTLGEIKIPVHHTVLQQVMLNLIGHILHIGYRGPVKLASYEDAVSTAVYLELRCLPHQPEMDLSPLRALTATLGAVLDEQQEGENLAIRLVFQKMRHVSVLVVDDNSQVVQLYQRCTANSRYDISHAASGVGLLERLEAEPADILMIDILLPDIDGWELLLQLRRNPVTSAIPVIICSVLGNEEMARSLGAARYLSKPIDCRSLLKALDEISAGL